MADIIKMSFTAVNNTLYIMNSNSIFYFEKRGRHIKIVNRQEEAEVLINISMKKLYTMLSMHNLMNGPFLRPHCSFIVNMNHIRSISTKAIIMSNSDRIPISVSLQKEFISEVHRHICHMTE